MSIATSPPNSLLGFFERVVADDALTELTPRDRKHFRQAIDALSFAIGRPAKVTDLTAENVRRTLAALAAAKQSYERRQRIRRRLGELWRYAWRLGVVEQPDLPRLRPPPRPMHDAAPTNAFGRSTARAGVSHWSRLAPATCRALATAARLWLRSIISLARSSPDEPVDIRRARLLLAVGQAKAAALLACVGLERGLRRALPLTECPSRRYGLRSIGLALRAAGLIDQKQFRRLRWLRVRRNRLVHGCGISRAGAATLVEDIAALLAEVKKRKGGAADA